MFTKKLSSILLRGISGLGLGMLMLVPATLASATTPAGGPSSAASSATMFGATISSSADLSLKTSEFGHMPIVRVYYPGLPNSNAWSTGLPGANKSAVVVSFKALPTAILSGSDDAALEQFFDTAPTGHAIYYTYYHEPEDNISAGEFTLSDYLAAWAHVVNLANGAHNTSLHSALVLMAYDFDPHSGRNWTNYLPPGHIISTIVWDAYPNNTGMGTPDPSTSPSFMGSAVAASKAAGLPFGFAEFNTTTIPGRPAWYTSVGAYCQSSGALFCTLYDDAYNGGLGGSGTFYVTDAASEAAWNAVVSGSGTGTTPPSVPTNLAATAVSGSQVNLSWTASTDNVGVSAYDVYRDGTKVGTSATTSYSDKNLTDGTAYEYAVSAVDGAGNMSGESSTVSITTLPSTAPPSVPTNLAATAVSGSQVNLSWTASTDSAGVSGYNIYRDGNIVGTSTTTSYSDMNLAAGTVYGYAVSAFDGAGDVSGESSTVSATTLPSTAPPSPPTHLVAGAWFNNVWLSWSASVDSNGTVAGYRVFRNGRLVATTKLHIFFDGNLASGTTYHYTVEAFDTAGNTSRPSASVAATTLAQHSRSQSTTASPPVMHPGTSSFGVKLVQYGLQQLGFYSHKGALNGNYGRVTSAAVVAFQKRYHTVPSRHLSQFGTRSWAAMAGAHAAAASMPTLLLNERSVGVEIMQFGLKQLGFYPGSGLVTGTYGPVTNTAAQAFQNSYACIPSPNVPRFGEGSWSALTNA